MVKETPSAARLAAMILFTASCVGILLYLWLVFGGSVPLRPEGYRVKVQFPEATQLAQEADVRISGVNVGKVKTKEPDNRTGLTETVLELDERYAPIPRDTRAILRQKTLLGETYVELSPGTRGTGERWRTAAGCPPRRCRPRSSSTRSSAPSIPRRVRRSRSGWTSRDARSTGEAGRSTTRSAASRRSPATWMRCWRSSTARSAPRRDWCATPERCSERSPSARASCGG